MAKVNVIIPTRNEEGNIAILLDKIIPYGYEVIVADDSDDRTPEIAKQHGAKVIKGRRLGLAQAVLDGIDSSDGDYIIVMDADLQHPPEMLPQVVEQLHYHDFVLMTKHNKEAMADMSLWRKFLSNLGTWTTKVLVPAPVSDPMSGYFGIRRKCLEGIPRGEYYQIDYTKLAKIEDKSELDTLSEEEKLEWYKHNGIAQKMIGIEGIGFKIGLELITKAKWVSHTEIPIHFAKRGAGESKGAAQGLQKHLWRLLLNSLSYEIVLPIGSQEYFYFYESNDWNRKWKYDIAVKLKEITGSLNIGTLLDVGCGSSPNINYMVADKKSGIDINNKALEWIKDYSDASFKYGDARMIPFDDNLFDTTVCIEVLEHLTEKDVKQALSEIVRVTKTDGHIVLATPNYGSLLWKIIENSQHILQPKRWTKDHKTKFTRESLNKMCRGYGLEEVRYDGIMKNMDMLITYRNTGEGGS